MKRRDFIKNTSIFGAGSAIMLNGTAAWAGNTFAHPLLNCADVGNRALVIVRLAGANDGLNTVIPLAQYAEYSSLRPTLKLANTGANSIINLNATTGLHPAMTGFANLLQQNKLAIFPGVGYPSPNYSHFAGENTMFAGKDGTTNASLPDGVMGRYLEKVYPGMAGHPNSVTADPVSIHMGNSNPNHIFNNTNNPNIEYNITNMQGLLFGQLDSFTNPLPPVSEYNDLLNYIHSIEEAMNIYYNRVVSVFNAGNNSTTTYPNTQLGKQLKTVARLIKGGSKTKIFMVTLGGFDTHVDQIQIGSTHLGSHANLLTNISSSITAFQADIEALGIADKITTVTFSEFGRQVKQNASLGTDHGDISPFFVIGQNINGGVYGNHPSLAVPANSTGSAAFFYPASERKYDYRQIYATLLQDWLGADASVMSAAQMDATSIGTPAATKIPNLVSASQNASPSCLSSSLVCSLNPYEEITCVKITEVNGWSYYAPAGYGGTQFNFAIEHTPVGIGANTSVFTTNVVLTRLICTYSGNRCFKATNGVEGLFLAGYFWTFKIQNGNPNGFVNIRFFKNDDIINETINESVAFQNQASANWHSPMLWFKTKRPFLGEADILPVGLRCPIIPLGAFTSGMFNGFSYQQWNGQTNIKNNSGGCLVKVTNQSQLNTFGTPGNASKKGALRFNNMKNHFEGYDGTDWVPLKQ